METLEFTCDINAPLEKVWAFHNSVETLFKLTPPGKHARLLDPPEPMREGVIYRIRVRQFGIIPITMHSLIHEYTPPTGFVDIQLPGKGPFKSWEHRHQFTAVTPTCTRLTDHVTYEVPLGVFGSVANALFVRRDLQAMFAYRHAVTRKELEGSG